MAPIPDRKMAIAALAIVVSVAVGATFVQAALGRPLIPWGSLNPAFAESPGLLKLHGPE
jgi:hypothetical protein